MLLEQPAKLNKYVDNSIPLTWAVRWRALKPGLPLLVCSSVFLLEQIIFRLWLRDESLLSAWPILLVAAFAPVILICLLFEGQTRWTHCSKRTLRLEPKRVFIRPAKCERVTWERIQTFRFEPLFNAPGLSKLTVAYSLDKKGKLQREWSMVLQQPGQEQALLSELEHLRQVGANHAEVSRLSSPGLSKPRSPSGHLTRAMIAMALALWCLMHGAPLLCVGLSVPRRQPEESEPTSQFTAQEKAKLGRTVLRFFSSPEQFRKFLVMTGSGLTGIGGVFYWLTFRLLKKRPKDEPRATCPETK